MMHFLSRGIGSSVNKSTSGISPSSRTMQHELRIRCTPYASKLLKDIRRLQRDKYVRELDDPSLVEQGSDIGRQERTFIRTSGFESVHHAWIERIPLGKHSLIFTCAA